MFKVLRLYPNRQRIKEIENEMYLYNKFLMNILNDINTMLCPIEDKSNTIELTDYSAHFLLLGLRLTLC